MNHKSPHPHSLLKEREPLVEVIEPFDKNSGESNIELLFEQPLNNF
jgi:hypothetical protein